MGDACAPSSRCSTDGVLCYQYVLLHIFGLHNAPSVQTPSLHLNSFGISNHELAQAKLVIAPSNRTYMASRTITTHSVCIIQEMKTDVPCSCALICEGRIVQHQFRGFDL